MRVFINDAGSLLGTLVTRSLSDSAQQQQQQQDSQQPESQTEPTTPLEFIGTHSGTSNNNNNNKIISNVVDKEDKAALRAAVLSSDVIIYSVLEPSEVDDAKSIIQDLSSSTFEREKVFIFVSSILTWARTAVVKEDDADQSFIEEDYKRRRSHPNFKPQFFLEKLALRIKNEKVKSFVVCSGLLYGEGEDWLHFLFKKAWMGEPVPCIGDGGNAVPSIHVRDLASVISQLSITALREANATAQYPDIPRYILAVDGTNNTLRELATAISNALGSGKVDTISKEDAPGILEAPTPSQRTQAVIDTLTASIRAEPVAAADLIPSWHSEGGIVGNLAAIITEYRVTRGLTPIKIFIHGPPVSGKTTLAKQIAKQYGLFHLHASDALNEFLASQQPQHTTEGDTEKKPAQNTTPQQITDEAMAALIAFKIKSWNCRNQGYILDGFPSTSAQATLLFNEPEQQQQQLDDDSDAVSPVVKIRDLLPEYVIALDASDDTLRERVSAMTQPELESHSGTHGFSQRLAEYRDQNTDEKTVLSFFEQVDAALPIYFTVANNPNANTAAARVWTSTDTMVSEIIGLVGKPHNYGPTKEELLAEQQARDKAEADARSRQEEERNRQEGEEREVRDRNERERLDRVHRLEQEERELLSIQSEPFRAYLIKHIMPVLSKGLIDVVNIRPSDPIDYLAEYLFKHAEEEEGF